MRGHVSDYVRGRGAGVWSCAYSEVCTLDV